MQKPPVIILAGGANSRFFPFNAVTHKGALMMHGQTLLGRTLASLKAHQYQEIVVVISPRDEEHGRLKELINQSNITLNLSIFYVVQPAAKGMGDALLRAAEYLSKIDTFTSKATQQIAVISPYQTAAGELLDHMLSLGEMTLCTTATRHPGNFGIVHFNDTGWADGIVEKPPAGTEPSDQKILTLYVLNNGFLKILTAEPAAEYNFETALDKYLQIQPAPCLKLAVPPPTLKYAWDIFQFQQLFESQLTSFRDRSAHIADTAVIDESQGPVWIDAGAKIGHASRIVGPAFIGKNVEIGDFCLVRQASLEAEVRVGAHSEIARSIMMPGSSLHRGYVGDSIIGNHSKLGAGFVSANKRFDRQPIPVEVKGVLVNSGQGALGALIGEQVQVGTQVCTMPGVCIGSNSLVFPGAVVARNLLTQATLKPQAAVVQEG